MLISMRSIAAAVTLLGLASLSACSSSGTTSGAGGSGGSATTATSTVTSASGGEVPCDQVCTHLASACSSAMDCAAECPQLDAATRSCLAAAADCAAAASCASSPTTSSTGGATTTGTGQAGDCDTLCTHVSSACGNVPESTDCPAGCPAWSDIRKSCVAQMTDCTGIINCNKVDAGQHDGHLGSSCVCSTTQTDSCEATGNDTGCDSGLTCYAYGRIGQCGITCATTQDCPAGAACVDHLGPPEKHWCAPS
jgi:hypothetical protein